MLNQKQFRELVVRQALQETGLWSQAAENLVFGTALFESALTFLTQTPSGPGRGVYQIEGDSYFEVIKYLRRKENLASKILGACHYKDFPRDVNVLVGNLKYATLICRAFYWRFEEPLPDADDLWGIARYYCKYYNTYLGKATVEGFVSRYELHLK